MPEPMSSTKISAVVAVAAFVAAATPHFYFGDPYYLLIFQPDSIWFAISVWAPCILAGAAVYVGIESEPFQTNWALPFRPLIMPLAFLSYIIITALHQSHLFMGLTPRPWSGILVGAGVLIPLAALEVLYWQGLVQRRLLQRLPVALRTMLVCLLPLVLLLPFTQQVELGRLITSTMPLALVASLSTALLFETGYSLKVCAANRAALAGIWVWTHQALFL